MGLTRGHGLAEHGQKAFNGEDDQSANDYDVPLDQLEQATNADEAILFGELELPGYWGVGGAGGPEPPPEE